jgi:hypothetical protein
MAFIHDLALLDPRNFHDLVLPDPRNFPWPTERSTPKTALSFVKWPLPNNFFFVRLFFCNLCQVAEDGSGVGDAAPAHASACGTGLPLAPTKKGGRRRAAR